MKNKLFFLVFLLINTFSFSQDFNIEYGIPFLPNIKNNIELIELCSGETIQYEKFEKNLKKIVRKYVDSLKLKEELTFVDKSFILNQEALLSDSKYQLQALANSLGITTLELKKKGIDQFCYNLLEPDDPSLYIDFTNKEQTSLNQNIDTKNPTWKIDKPTEVNLNWPTYWAKASWNSHNSTTQILRVPYGTQLCKIFIKKGGRGRIRKWKEQAYSYNIKGAENKVFKYVITGRADGNNEWHDRKSAKVTFRVEKVVLIPWYFNSTQKENCSCTNWNIKSQNPEKGINYGILEHGDNFKINFNEINNWDDINFKQ